MSTSESRNYLVPVALVTCLFFLWAIGVNSNFVLLPHMQGAFGLNNMQAAIIDSAFFGAYFCAALPAGLIIKKYGYKAAIIVGLGLGALGAILVTPAMNSIAFPAFLAAFFIFASGMGFLETAANPLITELGDKEGGARRLNFAQAFNGLGAVFTAAVIAGIIITSPKELEAEGKVMGAALGITHTVEKTKLATFTKEGYETVTELHSRWPEVSKKALDSMGPLDAARAFGAEPEVLLTAKAGGDAACKLLAETVLADAAVKLEAADKLIATGVIKRLGEHGGTVKTPFLIIAGVFILLAIVIGMTKFPDIKKLENEASGSHDGKGLWAHKWFSAGVLTLFFYVGGQICMGAFCIKYCLKEAGETEAVAVTVGLPMLIAFMVGRWVGTALMQKIPAWKVLASFSFLAILPLIYIIAVGGPNGRTCLIVSEFFMSICFPTIFALSIKDLGNRTEMASSALIMSIVGGAILPPMMGAMADSLSATPDKMYQTIYIIPALCFAGVTVFSLCYRKLKPDEAA